MSLNNNSPKKPANGGGGGARKNSCNTTSDTSACVGESGGAGKRLSICSQHGTESRTRDLSPGHNNGGQRKLSADYRNKDEDTTKQPFKPIRFKHIGTKHEAYDTLHCKSMAQMTCSREMCNGSIMFPCYVNNIPRKPDAVLEHAKDFLEQYFTSIKRLKSPAHENRWQQVQREVESTGTYHLTETELIYGAKLAWRNAYRCIGRIQWSKLQVFDCRYVTTTSGMFEAVCNHIKYATNKGNIRSAITIFPQRTDGLHDYRIWNSQLVSYAGYRSADGTVIGDPLNVEFTELCMKLGWKSKQTPWDVLPMVFSANGHDPEYYEYPEDLILQVPIEHPTYEWFGEMGLRWYAVPAVSGMLFDCGGIQFSATAFSGWYMSTEIGCRNLCDPHRRNLLEPIAIKMGLDTRNPTSLWKDKALVEANIAVLYSYQIKNVTIVDHHTASESFMKHLENEVKLRNGCPADWVWIVPPMSASVTPVYHQEMLSYLMKPSFEYQEPAAKTHIWKKNRDPSKPKKPKRKFHFKQIARAVKFTSKLFGRALSKRITATVLYATETGKSENYAKQLCELLGHAFNAQVYNMADYDISSIEHEALLLVVGSTFGNGDPPENGEAFAHDLYAMKLQETEADHPTVISDKGLRIPVSSKSFIKQNSRINTRSVEKPKQISRLDSLRGSLTEYMAEESFGPLSNVRFAVFGLGSSAYPNFAAFGKYVDNLLGELGGERLLKLATGDEMCGQEQSFQEWAPEVFKIACETFCLDLDESMGEATRALRGDQLNINTLRFTTNNLTVTPLVAQLEKYHNKKTAVGTLIRDPSSLQTKTEKYTILVEIQADGVKYEPGDHIGVFPINRSEIVDGVLKRLVGVNDVDAPLRLEVLRETHTQNGVVKNWTPHEKLPVASMRTILSRFLDITTPPSRNLLSVLVPFCENGDEAKRMQQLVDDSGAYEDWRYLRMPHLLEVLEEFPSCKVPAAVLIVNLMPLQPRFYSISSSLRKHPGEIHLTVAIVKYRSQDGDGPEHFGVCSNYLSETRRGEQVHYFIRSAGNFHVPKDAKSPMLLIGPGTGIAPFRSFWQHYDVLKHTEGRPIPKILLLFGCRSNMMDLYAAEKKDLLDRGVLDKVYLALSREPNVPKTYVQDIALKQADAIYELIVKEKGHVYVCGDVTMAEHVYQTLRKIIAAREQCENEAEKLMLSLRDENRYHEDIFGITLRTAEVQNKSRAKIRMAIES